LRISASGVLFSSAYPSGQCRSVGVILTLQYGRDWAVVQDFSKIDNRTIGQMWQGSAVRKWAEKPALLADLATVLQILS